MTTTQNQKQLTKEAVLIEAQRQIINKGETSTLEVKNALRKAGYHAIQDDVSTIMAQLCEEEGWPMTDNQHYRIYSGPAIQAIMIGSIQVAKAVVQSVPGIQLKKVSINNPTNSNTEGSKSTSTTPAKNNSTNIEMPLATPVAGCWEANSALSGKSTLYFDAKLSRDKVRSLYAKVTGTSRNDARARQYKK